MKVAVIGSGGRESAIGMRLARELGFNAVVLFPGNAGIESQIKCIVPPLAHVESFAQSIVAEQCTHAIIGSEMWLVRGLADVLRQRGVMTVGPNQQLAQIEASKVFAKSLMARLLIPTAKADVVDRAALESLAWSGPVALKASGLAAGKGVVVVERSEEWSHAKSTLLALNDEQTYVVEEMLVGSELSLIALVSGRSYVLFEPAKDHKRAFDGDAGPNTGGMGAYAPAGALDQRSVLELGEQFIRPIADEFAARGTPYQGFIFAGLMMTQEGPRALEYNARFGDPEAQVLMHGTTDDVAPLLDKAARGDDLGPVRVLQCLPTVGVVVVESGYPTAAASPVQLGARWYDAKSALYFGGVERRTDGSLWSTGGRVATCVGQGATLSAASGAAYALAESLLVDGLRVRRDIHL